VRAFGPYLPERGGLRGIAAQCHVRRDGGFRPETALARQYERETQAFERLHHLGLSKLYRMASLPRDVLGKLKIDEPIRVPGAGEKTIEVMTIAELDRALGGLATPPVPRAKVGQVVAYRFRLAGLRELNAQLVKQRGAVDRGTASELVAELLGLVQELEQAFGA
jgi:hypothetical protein